MILVERGDWNGRQITRKIGRVFELNNGHGDTIAVLVNIPFADFWRCWSDGYPLVSMKGSYFFWLPEF